MGRKTATDTKMEIKLKHVKQRRKEGEKKEIN